MAGMGDFDIIQLSDQNKWWIDRKEILKDSKLSELDNLAFRWAPRIRHYITLDHDIIYTIRGPRQIGKTTLIKSIIKDLLLKQDVNPVDIFFWSFERNDAKELNSIIQTYLDWRIRNKNSRKYLFLDEICSVKNWSKELIYFANKGDFQNCSIVVTGSNSMDLKHSTERMPGRRGGDGSNPLDKILLPMKFSEFVTLTSPEIKNKLFDFELIEKKHRQAKIMDLFKGKIGRSIENLMLYKKELDSLLETYLLTGGIPSAINEFMKNHSLSPKVYNIYLTSIIGDLNKSGYKEHYFKQMIREVFNTLSNPVSWNSFTKKTDIKSHNTVQEYATALEELYIANMSMRRSIHDRRTHLFNKKLYVLDPFIFHALHGWSNGKTDYYANSKANTLNLEMKSKLIESIVYSHLCRFAYGLNPRDLFDPKDVLFYYKDKNEKEVDFVLFFDDQYFPFEVKYQAKIADSDFVGFKSFKKGILVTKDELGKYRDYVKIPVSLLLLLI